MSADHKANERNLILVLEFDGTNFCGWQAQSGQRTIQGEMEVAIAKVTGEQVRVTGCSRTDSGVHARAFVMNFYTASGIPADRFRYPLNAVLPPDIRVKDSREAAPGFHARKHALRKIYSYRFLNADTEPAIGRDYTALEKGTLDEAAMRRVLPLICGTHDFKAFRSEGSSVRSTVRTIHTASLVREGALYTLTVEGDGFLYNMVRILAGTLFYVGHGTRTPEDVARALATGERELAGKVAPAKGLTLERVFYREADLSDRPDTGAMKTEQSEKGCMHEHQ